MGFRCPACKQDFFTDRAAWQTHVSTAHDGVAALVVDATLRLVEATAQEKQAEAKKEEK